MIPSRPVHPNETWVRVQALIDLAEARRCSRRSVEEAEGVRVVAEAALRTLRCDAEWASFVEEFELDPADQQILTIALAPVAQPRISWYYRMLQSGDMTGFAGIDLICELLDVSPLDAIHYRNRLTPSAPLVRRALLVSEHRLPYAPLRPTRRTLQRLLGLAAVGSEVPGATLVSSRTTLDDVVCPSSLKSQLRQFSRWTLLDRHAQERWGISPGHGPVALLAGPSGTGKTMAALAIAAESGRALYRVDLGMLVSKYIGETEQNLNALFDGARELDCVLLFDEADSLFGKRGDIRDTKDRYANMEVGHLLSRIEEHEGMCILTTNLREHIDAAFLRRIDAVFHFKLPAEDERCQLWSQYLRPRCFTALTAERTTIARELAGIARLAGAQITGACRFAARYLADECRTAEPDAEHCLRALAVGLELEIRKSSVDGGRPSLGFLQHHVTNGAAS